MDEYQGTGQPPVNGTPRPPQERVPLPPVQAGYGYADAGGQGPAQHYGYTPQHVEPPRRRGGAGRGRVFLQMLCAGIIGALLVLLIMPAIFGVNPYDLVRGKVKSSGTQGQVNVAKTTSNVSPSQGASDVTAVAKKVTPSIVNIDVQSVSQSTPFSLGQTESGTGSGVIYSADGYIITNNHVVADAQDITVTLASGTEVKAKKVGTDPENDIAVVKIDKTGLPAITVGNSDALQVGQLVVAVGSPLGFEQTVTAGIVSALHRTVAASSDTGQSTTVLTDLIQTDAPINPGNSGGALCDGGANLIGINALIASQSGGSEGIGFAIPVNTAKRVADAIIAGKPVSHPYIGVQSQTVSSEIATQYHLPVSEGAYVTYIVPNGPAQKAGIQTGDIIVAAGGQPVKAVDDLVASVRKTGVGQKISITYYRGTDKKTVDVTVQEEPANLGQSMGNSNSIG
ncbi:MAG TPA: trypsin-like peptidase domain-containing protein [Candidatus Anoxymicrobiaceae bacterium]